MPVLLPASLLKAPGGIEENAVISFLTDLHVEYAN